MLSLAGGLALCGARLGWLLFRVAADPPDDPAALAMWERKRRWLHISELSALPAFATFAVLVGKLRHRPVEGVILLSMVLGELGFAFFLVALQHIDRKSTSLNSR